MSMRAREFFDSRARKIDFLRLSYYSTLRSHFSKHSGVIARFIIKNDLAMSSISMRGVSDWTE